MCLDSNICYSVMELTPKFINYDLTIIQKLLLTIHLRSEIRNPLQILLRKLISQAHFQLYCSILAYNLKISMIIIFFGKSFSFIIIVSLKQIILLNMFRSKVSDYYKRIWRSIMMYFRCSKEEMIIFCFSKIFKVFFLYIFASF